MLQIVELYKSFDGSPLLKGVSFNVNRGEVVCILGASGSGKSTLLRIIAGLEEAEGGIILWNDRDISAIPTHKREFSLMFQDYALFPHLNVRENIEYGMRRRAWQRLRINQKVSELSKMVGLEGYLEREVTDLSGGEQQRVALARAMAIEPELLMLDEPLGALDRKMKQELLAELRGILRDTKLPAIYVTHDQDEAFAIADRVVLLEGGVIVQDDKPEMIFDQPASRWVAEFMGLGNVVPASRLSEGWKTPIGIFSLDSVQCLENQVLFLIRPPAELDPDGPISGIVTDVVFDREVYIVELNRAEKYELKNQVKIGQKISLRPERISIVPID